MQFLLPLLVLFVSVGFNNATGYTDRDCDKDPSNLWLDVVIVVDNSQNMTMQNLHMVFANIVEVFGQNTRIGTNYDDPRSTRIGLVTYNNGAKIVADLNKFQSFTDFYNGVQSALSFLSPNVQSTMHDGLSLAEQLLTTGRSNNYRSNYKQLVIVYAATYQGTGEKDPSIAAEKLKNNGVSIAVVDMTRGSPDVWWSFQRVASYNMTFHYNYDTTYLLTNAAFIVNCYCRDTWRQFQPMSYAMPVNPTGVCLKSFNKTTSWQVAKLSCQDAVTNGYLATDFTDDKHQFLQYWFMMLKPGFHIGLNFVNGNWMWQQPAGQQQLWSYDIMSFKPPTFFWNTGYPKLNTTNTGVMMVLNGTQSVWENVNAQTSIQYYICEVDACDTKTYCS